MKLLTPKYLPEYRSRQKATLAKHLDRIERRGLKHMEFQRWARIAGAVASSQIEGSSVTVDEFMDATPQEIEHSRDLRQVQELIDAYSFATRSKLTLANLLKAHKMMGATLSAGKWAPGEWRTKGVHVMEREWWGGRKVVYTGAEPSAVPGLMNQLMGEVQDLSGRKLSTTEVFYYAALLHLQFVSIHPLSDGNGRTARLLEKWFMAGHLGQTAWWINSELYYRMHPALYYRHLRGVGPAWDAIDLSRSLPFLLLLPRSLRQK